MTDLPTSCVTHVTCCIPGSLTKGFLWSRWQRKRSRHSRRMRSPQFYVSGKMPIVAMLYATQCFRLPHFNLCIILQLWLGIVYTSEVSFFSVSPTSPTSRTIFRAGWLFWWQNGMFEGWKRRANLYKVKYCLDAQRSNPIERSFLYHTVLSLWGNKP